ncbi:transforming growth factor beta receptor type 3 [Penaeus vannamei]|uniref:transforming growth factor beta receptor type 3 n=1 Tax=Penaeus vannamei TaxID=6689 RepID=UPI00387FA249
MVEGVHVITPGVAEGPVRLQWATMRRAREISGPSDRPAPPQTRIGHAPRPSRLATPSTAHQQLQTRPLRMAGGAPQQLGLVRLLTAALLLHALVAPCAGGQNGELCVVETPLKTNYFTPVVDAPATCRGCLFPRPPPDHAAPSGSTPIRQVHIIHVDDPEGGAVEVVLAGKKKGADSPEPTPTTQDMPTSPETPMSRVALVLHSSRGRAPVVFTVTAQGIQNHTKSIILVSGDDEVRGSNLRYSIAHRQRLSEESLIPTMTRKFGFVTSYTRAPRANKVILELSEDDESGPGCGIDIKEDSPVSKCITSIEQPISGCYHHNMLGENDRDIHIIEVDGSSNENGSLVLEVTGKGERGGSSIGQGGSTSVERNITFVLRTSRPTTWSLHATSLQGTITLLVGGGDQVENTSVSGPGVMVEVKRIEVPATFDQLILTVLTTIGPPVSYTRTTSPNKITVVVPAKNENRVVLPSYIPINERPTVYAEDPTTLIHGALSVSCDQNSMTVAIPRRISERVGGISMSLADRSCTGVLNATHVVIKQKFSRCSFTHQNSAYQTTYTNYVIMELGPSISDDEDFDGSGYGSDDEYYATKIHPIQVQCQVDPKPEQETKTTTNRKSTTESSAGATYKMDIFRDRDHKTPITSSDLPATTNVNRRLYVRTKLASVMPWTAAYDADLRVVLEDCWLSNSSAPERPGAPRIPLMRKSCPHDSSIDLEPEQYHSPTSGFSFQVLPEYSYLGSFYLHCQLGVCSADSLPRPAVNRCINPGHYCNEAPLMQVFLDQPSSSSLQTLTVGPFTIGSSTKSAWSDKNTGKRKENSKEGMTKNSDISLPVNNATEDKTQIIVLGGLSTEIVVGIALASFIIGVCLTATLWVIHMKTDPRRQKRPEGGAPRNSGYDLSAHSGSSTPSSQAPMTA